MSRFLNPGDPEDKEYLHGLPEGVPAVLPGDEIWFGVWMRVKNYSDETLTPDEHVQDRGHRGGRVPARPARRRVQPVRL